MAPDLVDHVLGGVPSRLVGLGGVEVGAASEEQTGEGDEGEGLEDRPGIGQPLEGIGGGFLLENQVIKQSDDIADQDDEAPHEEHAEHGLGHIEAEQPQGHGDHQDEQGAGGVAPVAPKLVEDHADAVQATPDHEVPRGTVPQAA